MVTVIEYVIVSPGGERGVGMFDVLDRYGKDLGGEIATDRVRLLARSPRRPHHHHHWRRRNGAPGATSRAIARSARQASAGAERASPRPIRPRSRSPRSWRAIRSMDAGARCATSRPSSRRLDI
jgi:hypothetical protein